MWTNLFFVAIGSAMGGMLRYAVATWFKSCTDWHSSAATLAVNVSGCFLIGLLASFLQRHFPCDSAYKLLLITGFCGGFTTFSTFCNDALTLTDEHRLALALVYAAGSVVLGLGACWLGLRVLR